ncbi:putative GGDEF domain protein [Escherichia coli]|nr:putative GGDEF domain protein [Escherichia coli]
MYTPFQLSVCSRKVNLLRNSIAIFALTTLFYFIGAELRLVHELFSFWPLNGVMAGVVCPLCLA